MPGFIKLIPPEKAGKHKKILKKNLSAPIPILKLDFGFGSQYRNQVLVAH